MPTGLEVTLLWITQEIFQDAGCGNQFSTGKRTAHIKMLVKLLIPFTPERNTEETLHQVTGEAFCTTILDSRVSKTVCGKTWLRRYREILPKKKKN